MAPAGKVSQKDIASRCQVSQAIVSAVLSGKTSRMKFSPETRDLILKTAKDLGYRRHRGASQMKRGQKGLIAVLAPRIYNLPGHLISAVCQEAKRRDLLVVVEEVEAVEEERSIALEQDAVDGILFFSLDQVLGMSDRVLQSSTPVLTINSPGSSLPSLLYDEKMGCEKSIQHFVSLGCGGVVMMVRPQLEPWSKQRIQAFEDVCRSEGVEGFVFKPSSTETIEKELCDFLKSHPKIDSFLVNDPEHLHDLERAQVSLGRQLGRDFRVLTYFFRPTSSSFGRNPLSLHLDYKRAAELLLDELQTSETRVDLPMLPYADPCCLTPTPGQSQSVDF